MKKKNSDLLQPFVAMYGVCAGLWAALCVVDAVKTGGLATWKAVCAGVLVVGFLVLLAVYLRGRK